MKSVSKLTQVALILLAVAALSSCSLGQAAAATATPVDVNAVMTSAAATAFVQLTDIAGQASPTTPATSAPSQTPTLAATATQNPSLLLLTPTEAAGGLPAVASPTLDSGLPVATLAAGGLPTATLQPSLTPFPLVGSGGKTNVAVCYNSKFVADVTIPDGTVMKPYEKFTKIWRIQNTGTCTWDQGFGLTIWSGPSMGSNPIYFSNNDQKIGPGGVVDLSVEMHAPSQTGEYVAHWTMIDDKGTTFGGDLTVFIKVAK